jgi:ubiquinone/menaquinone biosynthesis C-methylase UbiE
MFADPVKNLKAFGLREDMIVADLGAGTGFYALGAAEMVPKGKVYAVEVQKDFLAKIRDKIKDAHLSNIEVIWGDVEKIGGTKIKENIADAVIASNILFQVEDHDTFIKELHRILKFGGRVLLVDWSSGMAHVQRKIPKATAREMFERKGFAWERDIDAGSSHYGMILRKQ